MFDIINIITSIKKKVNKRDLFYILGLFILYFSTRFYRLTYYPIFSDEGIYIRWASIAWHDATWRFISLTDGRQPLQTWLTIPFMKLFPNDLLFAGRSFAVFGGFLGMVGIGLLTYFLFNKRSAYISMFLYLVAPFFIFYDRIALIDTWVNASAIWIMFFALLLARYIRLDISLIFGIMGGLFLLAKSSVMMFLGLSIFTPLVYLNSYIKERKKIFNYVFLLLISISLAYLIYNIQRLSPFFHFINSKNTTFILTPKEWISSPFQVVGHNITHILRYVMHNLGYGIFFVGIFGLIMIFRKKRELFWFFIFWFMGLYIPMVFFMKVLFPRYTIFISPIFIVSAGYFLDLFFNKKNKLINFLLIVFILTFPIYFAYFHYFDYANQPLNKVDRGQYIEDWPAGYGAKEIMEYVRNHSNGKRSIVVCEGNFGMAGDVLDVFKKDSDNIDIKPYWPLNGEDIENESKINEDINLYVVFSHRKDFPMQWPIKLIKEYKKPGNKSSLFLFKIIPHDEEI